MRRFAAALLCLALAIASPAWALKLERVVLVQRHGVRPPTSSNEVLAKFAAAPWPSWSVPPGELTAHGALTVALMGETLRDAYRADGLLPSIGCPAPGEVVVWADGTDQRTRRSGETLAAALAPGCGLQTGWAPPAPRDEIFGGSAAPQCRIDVDKGRSAIIESAGPGGLETPASRAALARLQAILAPKACEGGPGTCFSGENKIVVGPNGPSAQGPMFVAAGLAEDLLLEYAEDMAPADVAWGRAPTEAQIAAVMAVHERMFGLLRGNPYLDARLGAPMARLVLAALAGDSGPHSGPNVKVLALAGHDTNLVLMAGVFGLAWTLPGEPDITAPATTLAFELWSQGSRFYVRPVLFYETLDQLRTLHPDRARKLVLTFAGCAGGPMRSCPLQTLQRRAQALIPPGCGGA